MTGAAVAAAGPATVVETDALVVGAGPVGLFQVFQLGLQEINAHVVDVLAHAGGQCAELYADKPIYDIPAVAVCTGQQLTDRLLQQIAPFRAQFHFGQQVAALARREDGRFFVQTSRGAQFIAKVVVIAAGAGAFVPRTLALDGLAPLLGRHVFHAADDVACGAGRHVVIAGDGDAALQAALDAAQPGPQRAASVTLVHRRDAFRAEPALVAAVQALRDGGLVRFAAGQITGIDAPGGTLRSVQLTAADGSTQPLTADTVLLLLGLSPRLGPIADWGFDMERRQIVVDTASFQTSVPGIFAVGDVNTYAGKRKLILCGFHEATLAAFAAVPHVFAQRRAQLQYTTTSTRLQQLLGVTPALPA